MIIINLDTIYGMAVADGQRNRFVESTIKKHCLLKAKKDCKKVLSIQIGNKDVFFTFIDFLIQGKILPCEVKFKIKSEPLSHSKDGVVGVGHEESDDRYAKKKAMQKSTLFKNLSLGGKSYQGVAVSHKFTMKPAVPTVSEISDLAALIDAYPQ